MIHMPFREQKTEKRVSKQSNLNSNCGDYKILDRFLENYEVAPKNEVKKVRLAKLC